MWEAAFVMLANAKPRVLSPLQAIERDDFFASTSPTPLAKHGHQPLPPFILLGCRVLNPPHAQSAAWRFV